MTVAETVVPDSLPRATSVIVATPNMLSESERLPLDASSMPERATVVCLPNVNHGAVVGSLYLPRRLRGCYART